MKIGIDLGTTFSVASYITEDKKAKIIPSSEGTKLIPSVIYFTDDEVLVGKKAKEMIALEPFNGVEFFKRQIGNCEYSFIAPNGKEYSAEELSAILLKKIKNDSEAYLGEKISEVIVTVPAYFDDAKRQATKDAAILAGLNVEKIINEPTAAALAYIKQKRQTKKRVMVYDLGGGTFDVTLMDIYPEKVDILATLGDKNLGGFDFDNILISEIIDKFEEEYNIDLYDHMDIMSQLRKKSIKMKKDLSYRFDSMLHISCENHNIEYQLSRDEFNILIQDHIERSINIMNMVMDDINDNWESLDEIILIGGSSRIPIISDMIYDLTNIQPKHQINPDEAVAKGAAWSTYYTKNEHFSTPDKNLSINEINSHSIGTISINTDTENAENTILIKRNTKIPTESVSDFFLIHDNQDFIRLKITEGEEKDINYVRIIGESIIELPDSCEKNQGVRIKISIDENQIVHVFALLEKIDSNGEFEYLGEIHLDRFSNLSDSEKDSKQEHLSELNIS